MEKETCRFVILHSFIRYVKSLNKQFVEIGLEKLEKVSSFGCGLKGCTWYVNSIAKLCIIIYLFMIIVFSYCGIYSGI